MAKKIVRVIHLDAKAASGSLKKMRAEAAKLQNALNAGLVPKKDRKAAIKHLQKLRGGIKNIREEYRGTTSFMDKLKKSMRGNFFPVSGALLFTQALTKIVSSAKEFLVNAVAISIEAKGVEFAFKKLGTQGTQTFDKIKISTRGLLSDLDIKKSIVEFDNFNLSLEESDTLLEFVSVRAAQTGKSVDYLKDSLVEGLSKESKLRIDNLGISAMELNAELEKTPSFIGAVANIARREISEAGNILDEAANSQTQWNAALENTKLKIGNFINNSGIISFFHKLGTSVLSTIIPLDTSTSLFKKQDSVVKDLQNNTQPLINRYKELIEKTILSSKEQKELNTLIQQISKDIPSATTGFDKFGKAIGISTTRAEEFIEKQQAIAQIKNKEAIKDQTSDLLSLDRQLLAVTSRLNTFNESGDIVKMVKIDGDKFSSPVAVKLTNEEIQKLLTTLDTITDKKIGVEGWIRELKGLPPVITETLEGVDGEIVKISEMTLEQLKALNTEEAKAEIKKRDDSLKLAEEIASNTIGIIKKIDQERVKAIEDDQTREQAILDVKLKNQIKEIEALNANEEKKAELISAVTTRIEKEKEAIQTKYAEAKTAKDNKFILDGLELELTALEDGSVEKLAAYQKYLDTKMEMELSSLDLTEQEKEIIRQNYKALKDEAENEEEQNKSAEDLEKLERGAKMGQDVLDGYIGVRANRDKAEIQRLQKESNTKVDILKNELASKLKNQNLTDTQKQKLQEEYQAKIDAIQEESESKQAAIKLKAWKREKTANILSAIINTALAITKASPNIPLQVAAGITGATQLAVMKSTKPPEFVDGGFTGQNTFYDDAYGGVTGVVHKNEWVAPEWMTSNPATANYINMLEGIRQNGFADGGFTSSTSQEETPQFDAETESLGIETALLAVAASNAKLTELLTRPILAVYDQDQILTIRDEINVFNSIQSNNTIS